MALIIGYGSPLRSDDALGGLIAEALGGLSLLQLSPELAEPISRTDFVVFIDARYGLMAGCIYCETIEPESSISLSHHGSPAALLHVAKTLCGSVPPALLISITGASFDYGDSLSPPLQALLPTLIEQVRTIISANTHKHNVSSPA
jgi:hydrogenase maturation protease